MSNFSHFEDQIRECFERVVYTRKAHVKIAYRCSITLCSSNISELSISTLTTSGTISTTFAESLAIKVVSATRSIDIPIASEPMEEFDPGCITQIHNSLQRKLFDIYKNEPQTNATAYANAQRELKRDEGYTFSNIEIDQLTPSSLRKAHK